MPPTKEEYDHMVSIINIKDYYTEREINGKLIHVHTLDDYKRYEKDRRKLERQGKIFMRQSTKTQLSKSKSRYEYYKSWGGMPFQDNNSLLKIDPSIFSQLRFI